MIQDINRSKDLDKSQDITKSKKSQIEIRQAKKEEWLDVADITESAYQQYAETMDKEFFAHYQKSTREMLLHEEGILRFLALIDGAKVGSVIFCPPYEREFRGTIVKNPFPEMRLLSVPDEHRNKGIAAALIDFCEAFAQDFGATFDANSETKAMTLHTSDYMHVAKAMYERRGYKRFADIDFHPAPGLTILGYIKELA